MNPINKHTVLKAARTSGKWTGYIAPSNVNSYHIKSGWHLGIPITIAYRDGQYQVLDQDGEPKTECRHRPTLDRPYNYDHVPVSLDEYLDCFASYNCGPELGYRVRFWAEA